MSVGLAILVNVLTSVVLLVYVHWQIRRGTRPAAIIDRIRKEVEGILLELNRTTEQNIGLIEERITSLKGFLDQADKRLVVLRREAEKQDAASRMYNNLKKRVSVPVAEKSQATGTEAVIELYRQGFSADLIAHKLKTTVGEVELIISIQDQKARP